METLDQAAAVTACGVVEVVTDMRCELQNNGPVHCGRIARHVLALLPIREVTCMIKSVGTISALSRFQTSDHLPLIVIG